MSKKIPVYICNRKRCKNGACDVCHNTLDIEYAVRDEGNPIIITYIEDPGDTWSRFMEVTE